MLLSKAIEILQDILRYEYSAHKTDKRDAIMLGLQALRRCQQERALVPQHPDTRLPGETPSYEPQQTTAHKTRDHE